MEEPEEATQEATEGKPKEAVELVGVDQPQEKIKDGRDIMNGTNSKVQELDPGTTTTTRDKIMKKNTGQKMITIIGHMGSTRARINMITIDQMDMKDLIVLEEGKDPGAQAGIEIMQEMKTLDKKEAEGETGKREDRVPGKEVKGDSTLVLDEVDAQRPLVMVGLLQATP